ncbi:hypothetical protein AVEN_70602-1 [Araneus ventricosus]|uniref:Uncharacterized protein n=1 Tax=Araneus ventricosus TaxID=182803 RepID=A0A4Y2CFP8_ARAVE|nr:hypothetical protein AVEN_70602-1 [Araneus ventricosus]
MAFSSFHSTSYCRRTAIKSHSTLLPFINEEITSPTIVEYLMNVNIAETYKVNQKQTAVIVADQQVYTKATHIQWRLSNTRSENKNTVMKKALLLRMMVLNLLNEPLRKSRVGTETILQSGFTGAGVAKLCLTSSHITRAKYAHELTLVVFYCLQNQAYKKYCQCIFDNETKDKSRMEKE